jgi:ATP-binding cassette subfamily B (MDR/TAP) protein 1
LLTLAILPFMGFGAIMEMKMYWGQEESANVKNEENSPGAILVETLLNIRTVASLVIEPIREREYSKALAKEDTVNGARTAFLKGAASGSGLFFQMWGMALMFWWGGKVLSDHPTLFSYRDYLISMFSLLFSLTGLSVSFMGITDKDKAKEAAKRIFELIDKKSLIDPLSNDGIKNVP